MTKPNIAHYPVWLRELIYPDGVGYFRSRQDTLENVRALRQIFNTSRLDPICRILSCLVVENIRRRFRDYEFETSIQEKFKHLSGRVSALEGELEALKQSINTPEIYGGK